MATGRPSLGLALAVLALLCVVLGSVGGVDAVAMDKMMALSQRRVRGMEQRGSTGNAASMAKGVAGALASALPVFGTPDGGSEHNPFYGSPGKAPNFILPQAPIGNTAQVLDQWRQPPTSQPIYGPPQGVASAQNLEAIKRNTPLFFPPGLSAPVGAYAFLETEGVGAHETTPEAAAQFVSEERWRMFEEAEGVARRRATFRADSCTNCQFRQ